MHTSSFKTCVIHHNGGYDGDCNIAGKDFHEPDKTAEVRVDFEDLKAFVLGAIAGNLVDDLTGTDLSPSEIMRLHLCMEQIKRERCGGLNVK